jgi:hypothetical protein
VNSCFTYRFRSPGGGLAADLVAKCGPSDSEIGCSLQIDRNVQLTLPKGVNWRDAAWLSFGLAVHAPDLIARNPEGLLVTVVSFTFPLAHFRSEVAALAMDGWVRREFDLSDRGFRVSLEEGSGNYRFHWGGNADPFSDDS